MAVSTIAAIALAFLTLAFFPASDSFWSQSVSFSCSYVAPAFDSIVYSRMFYNEGSYAVVLHNLRTGEIRPLSHEDDRTSMHGVSNGDEFLYFAVRGNSWHLAAGSVLGDGLELVRLTMPPLLRRVPRFPFPNLTPDGSVLAFMNGDELHLADLRTRTTRVADSFETLESALRVSARGRGSERRSEIWDVSVSQDLSRAAVVHQEEGSFELKVHSAEPGVPAAVVRRQPSTLMRPRWLPDGSGVTFIERSGNAWRVVEWRAESGRSTVLFESSRFIETAELHPDRRRLLLTLGDGTEFEGYFTGLHVHLLDLESGKLTRIGA